MSLVYPSHIPRINEPGGMPLKIEAWTWRTASRQITALRSPRGSSREVPTGEAAPSARISLRGCPHRPLLGWSVSALLHGAILAVVAVFGLHLPPSQAMPQKEPFLWEVSLLAAPPIEAATAEGVQSSTEAAAGEPSLHEFQETRSVEQPFEETAFPENAVPFVAHAKAARRVPSAPETVEKKPDEPQRAAIMPDAHGADSLVPPPHVEHQRDSDRLQVETQLDTVTVLQRPEAVSPTVIHRTILPDYTWLMETLRTRLERVKIYPRLAKEDRLEGRVVVQVLVQDDGRIAQIGIEESSGHSVLDEAALAALEAVSPLTLAHRLEKASVAMLVPITYQLE